MVLGRETRSRSAAPFTIFDQGDCLGAVKEILQPHRRRQEARRVGDPDAHLEREERVPLARGVPATRERRRLRRDHEARLPEVPGGAAQLPRVRLRRSRLRGRAPLEGARRHPRALAEAIPLRPRRRVPGHEPRAARGAAAPRASGTRTSASSATTTSRSTRGAAPTCATSSTSRSTSPARRSSSSSRTTARRAPILAVANAVIAKRTDAKYKKRLFTDKPGGEKVQARRRAVARGRGRVRRARDPAHHRARSSASRKDMRDPLSLERPGEAPRGAAPRAGRPVSDDRRAAVLRAQGGEGPPRLPQASR